MTGRGQGQVTGRVLDSLTLEPIAFVNIALEDGMHGGTTDIEGNFRIQVPPGYSGYFLVSHVSYNRMKLRLKPTNNLIYLMPASNVLREMTFVAEENPAWAIIRKAIAQKPKHNPANLASYRYISYNKFVITTSEPDTKTDSTVVALQHRPDSVRLTRKERSTLRFDSLAERSNLFLSESVTEKKVINPSKQKETLLALRVSGYKSPLFTNVATDYQPFSFYENEIGLFGQDYLNPISEGTFGRYDFYLSDTTYRAADTLFTIQFEPKKGKMFNGLYGIVTITTDGYAIKNVIASNSDPTALTGIRIQQNYEKVSGHWFPVELNTDLDLREYVIFGRSVQARHRSFFKEIEINPPLQRSEFGDIQVVLSSPPEAVSNAILDKYRSNQLIVKEHNTYKVMDSLMQKISWLDKGLEVLAARAWPAGPFDIDISKIMTNNRYELARFGIGLVTNDRLSRFVRLGGYYGYGIRDHQSKFGGDLKLIFNQNKDFFIRFSTAHDIYETGTARNVREGQILGSEVYRTWIASQYDKINFYRADIGYRILPDVHASVFLIHSQIRPTYDYRVSVDGDYATLFNLSETGVVFRYVKDENYMSLRGRKIFLSQKFPVVTFSVSKAINLFGRGDFSYTRADLTVKQLIKYKTLGKTKVLLSAGVINGVAPYGQLYNGRGARLSSFTIDYYFQTMDLYEFTVTEYASVFLSHNFGNVLVHGRYSKPELLLYHAMGVGELRHQEVHEGPVLQSMNRGYYESGVGVANLLRQRYVRIGYLGVGASVFYRYGPYRLASTADNFSYRINLGFTL